MAQWALDDIARRLPEIIDATRQAPQEIDLGDDKGILVISRKPPQPKAQPHSVVDVLMNSPLRDIDLGDDLRDKSLPREVEL